MGSTFLCLRVDAYIKGQRDEAMSPVNLTFCSRDPRTGTHTNLERDPRCFEGRTVLLTEADPIEQHREGKRIAGCKIGQQSVGYGEVYPITPR